MEKIINEMGEKKVVAEIKCNCCGNQIPKIHDEYFQDHLHVEKNWGYFSDHDGHRDVFDLCEDCYFRLLQSFIIPPNTEK
ncbi:MAG: hypothetical protein KHZ62_08840 [Clostridiales bacterium]|nr:hypothetical protein [Clostridiales bacterium]